MKVAIWENEEKQDISLEDILDMIAGEEGEEKRERAIGKPKYMLLIPNFRQRKAVREHLRQARKVDESQIAEAGSVQDVINEWESGSNFVVYVHSSIFFENGLYCKAIEVAEKRGSPLPIILFHEREDALGVTSLYEREILVAPSEEPFNFGEARAGTVVVYYHSEEFKEKIKEYLMGMGITNVVFRRAREMTLNDLAGFESIHLASLNGSSLEFSKACRVVVRDEVCISREFFLNLEKVSTKATEEVRELRNEFLRMAQLSEDREKFLKVAVALNNIISFTVELRERSPEQAVPFLETEWKEAKRKVEALVEEEDLDGETEAKIRSLIDRLDQRVEFMKKAVEKQRQEQEQEQELVARPTFGVNFLGAYKEEEKEGFSPGS